MTNVQSVPTSHARVTLLLVLALGCSDSDKQGSTQASTRCAHDVLESDLERDAPIGPGVDPATGKLQLVEGQHYVVSSTYGVPRPTSDGKPVSERYLALFGAIQQQLEREPGLLALQLGQSNACGSGRTLAIWKSEEAMYDFVTSRAHLDAMDAADELLQPGYAVTHWDATKLSQFSMEEAVRQLTTIEASR